MVYKITMDTQSDLDNHSDQCNPNNEDAFLGLDPNAKYCLADTMVLIPLCQGDPDVIRDVKRELGGAVLVILDIILWESAHKLGKMSGEKTNRKYFVSVLSHHLEPAAISFETVRFTHRMAVFWKEKCNGNSHPNLSEFDYALLCATIKRPDIDIMTDDKGLRGSIENERASKTRGKVRQVMRNYYQRRNDTAGFIRGKIEKHLVKDDFVKWNYRIRFTEFSVGNAVVASMDHSQSERVRVDLSALVNNSNKHGKLQSKLEKEIQDFFTRWKPARGGRRSPHGKDWYRQHRDDDYADLLDRARGRYRK